MAPNTPITRSPFTIAGFPCRIRIRHVRVRNDHLSGPCVWPYLCERASEWKGPAEALKTYDDTPIPESLGLVYASIYILLLVLFIPFAFSDVFLNEYEARSRHGIVVAEFPSQKVRYSTPPNLARSSSWPH
ncbi:hypothetical protein BC629DRAFT_316914 [Irpex lacteus]|nr:hypothetical protein BC629DRAFT_316914 [Irpex lacteus]